MLFAVDMARLLWVLSLLASGGLVFAAPQNGEAARDATIRRDVNENIFNARELAERQVATVGRTTVVAVQVSTAGVGPSSTTVVSTTFASTSSFATTIISAPSSRTSNPTGSSALATSSPSPTAQGEQSSGGGGLSGGAIAGIVVGVVAALVIAAIVGYIFARKRKEQERGTTTLATYPAPAGAHEPYVSGKIPAAGNETTAPAAPTQPWAGPSSGAVQTTITSGVPMSELPAETSAHRATQAQANQGRPWSPGTETPDGRGELPGQDEDFRGYR